MKRREGRGVFRAMEILRITEQMSKWQTITRADEIEMRRYGVIGPVGPIEECYAVWTGEHHIYFDGCDNQLEPLWVLEQIRGTDQPRPMTEEEARSHPWMKR